MTGGMRRAVLRKVYGVLFLMIMGLFLLLVIGLYNKTLPWQHDVTLYLQTKKAGNQLNLGGDVKIRGVFVGTIKSIEVEDGSDGNFARVTLRINTEDAKDIPKNVEARILPKTIFGEKFVELVIPGTPVPEHIEDGDTINQDRSKTAIETDKVFEDLLPLLQTLQPVKLNRTLYALASALERRGNALGNNLALADRYFSALNPNLPTINHDISGLADLADSIGAAAPDLLRLAANSAVSLEEVVVAKQSALETFFKGTAGFANTARRVIGDNENNFIQLAKNSRPILDVLEFYSGSFPCLLRGLTDIQPRLEGTFGTGPYLYVNIVPLSPQSRAYSPADDPQVDHLYEDLPGAQSCGGLPQPGVQYTYPHPGVPLATVQANEAATRAAAYGDIGPIGSTNEQIFVNAVAGPLMAVAPTNVPVFTNLLLGPILRGNEVSLQ
jgi:virulence factor Mce-like protein